MGRRRERMLIVNDHCVFRESLSSVLRELDKYNVTMLPARKADILRHLKESKPDILLLDAEFCDEDSLVVTRTISRTCREVQILVLGLKESENTILAYLEAGAAGYVLKRSSLDELRGAIRKVLARESVCSHDIVQSIFLRYQKLSRERQWKQRVDSAILSIRELEILQLVSQGLSNKEIAKRLFISLHTVKNHVHRILEKLKVDTRFKAVDYARKRNWLKAEFEVKLSD